MPVAVERYRIIDPDSLEGTTPYVEIWHELRRTPKGAWIGRPYAVSALLYEAANNGGKPLPVKLLRHYGCRFVSDHGKRHFAYLTMNEARASYRRRKQCQIQHARNSLAMAEAMLDWLDNPGKPQQGGHPFSLEHLR